MPANPKFLAARADEMRNRQLAHLPFPAWLCGVPISHLTPRHVNELRLEGNAFFSGKIPRRGDVFQFLWRLHPRFARPRRGRLPLGGALLRNIWGYGLRAGLARHRLVRHVAWLPIFRSGEKISEYLALVYQDNPAEEVATSGRRRVEEIAPPNSWIDNYCLHFGKLFPGWTPDQIVDHPLVRLLQIHREHLLAQPDGEVNVIDRSDALLGDA